MLGAKAGAASRHLKRSGALLLLAAAAGCSPLTATIGYQDLSDAATDAPTPDGGEASDAGEAPGPETDASPPSLPDGGPRDSSLPAQPDAANDIPCWHLPDVVNARKEAGVERVDEGEIYGATDKELRCDGGTSTDPVPVTYQRIDGAPIMKANRPYALISPVGPTAFLINFFPGRACMQGPIPNLLNSSQFGRSCGDFTFGQDTQALRFILAAQTPLPTGLTLCESSCSAAPP